MSTWKFLRLFVLLFIFVLVLGDTLLSKYRSTNWDNTLRVVLYPINGDNSEQSANYIAQLTRQDFSEIPNFMAEEAKQYGITVDTPMDVDLAVAQADKPPTPPLNKGNIPAVMFWT